MLIELCPVPAGAEAFLERLYASSRAAELAAWPWSAEQKGSFLRQQFRAQERSHREAFPGATRSLIVLGGQQAGQICVWAGAGELRLVSLTLLPEHQNRGVGTRLVSDLMAQAAGQHQRLTLHVEFRSRARHLYERLGFVGRPEDGVYCFMEWRPTAPG